VSGTKQTTPEASKEKAEKPKETVATAVAKKTVKLSYKDQREYDALPELLETIESELEALNEQMAQPDFYQQGEDVVQTTLQALNDKETELESAFERWELLEAMVMGEA